MTDVATSPKILKEAEKSPKDDHYHVKRETEIEVHGEDGPQEPSCAQANARSVWAGGNVKEGVKGYFDKAKGLARKLSNTIKEGAEGIENKAYKANVYLERRLSGESDHPPHQCDHPPRPTKA